MKKKTVAFVCVHNSCRSQIAEARPIYGAHVLDACPAGTKLKDSINPDAVRLMKIYGIDMEKTQHPNNLGDSLWTL